MAVSPKRDRGVNRTLCWVVMVVGEEEIKMFELADRWVKAVSDVTVGTVIVLVHVVLADRNKRRRLQPARA